MKNKIEIYRDFLFKLAFTNDIYVKDRDEVDRPYKFFVGFGNNSHLIKAIMKRRYWWQIVDRCEKDKEDVNFIWSQLKVGEFMGMMKNLYHGKKVISSFRNKNKKIKKMPQTK